MVCRGNYTLHHYDPPLLYDVNADPGEIFDLDPELYADILATIDKVKLSLYHHQWNQDTISQDKLN